MRAFHHYTDEEKQFIRDNVEGTHYADLAMMFNERFGCDISRYAMREACYRLGVRNGFDGRFRKGEASANKGQKMSPEQYEKCSRTMFRAGDYPANTLPVGSESTSTDGYIIVKVNEKRHVPKWENWKPKHRLVWEAHNGPIPDDCCIMFLDGDRTNCDISNLVCVKKKDMLTVNREGLLTDDPELNRLGMGIARLERKTYEKESGRK